MADAIRKVYTQQSNQTRLPSVFNDFDERTGYIQLQDASHRALTTNISDQQLVLINFSPNTDRTGIRSQIWKTMCHRRNKVQPNISYVTCYTKLGGVQIENLADIYARNRQYSFWLSPRGGGLDCHRTWEALYLDIIPIVWSSSLNILYEDLPIVVINDHSELNEQFLRTKLKEISMKKLSKEKIYNYEKLRNAYWRRLILSKSKHNVSQQIHYRSNLCWNARSLISWNELGFLS